jgi:hypothetical protein
MNRSSRVSELRARARWFDAVLRIRCVALLLVAAVLGGPAHAGQQPAHPHYRIEATIAPGRPQVDGTVEITFTNTGPQTLDEAVLFLFPNRFREPDPDINDFYRQFLYPDRDFDPGGMQLLDVRDGDTPSSAAPVPYPGLPAGTVVRMPIADLAPGATRRLTLGFRTDVPHRFGSFGEYEGQLTLVGGWYPYLAGLDASGHWAIDSPPGVADYEVTLQATSGLEMVLNGHYLPPDAPPAAIAVPAVHYLSLIAAPRLPRIETQVDGTRIVVFQRPPPLLSTRISPQPSASEALLAALRNIVAQRPAGVPPPPAELVVVEAPLRLDLTAPGEGDVVISDRMLEVAWLLRPFHELQLAQAVYAELLRPTLAAREPARDYYWVSEGLSNELAERFIEHTLPQQRSVYDWIDLFNVFAAVDRFESTPKIPFVGAFFPREKEADPLHGTVTTFNQYGPPGRVVLGKLREQLGQPAFDALIDRCLQTPMPLRQCLAQSDDPDVPARLNEWTDVYPAIDYRIDSTDFNQPEDGQFHSSATVRRVSSQPYAEPVTVRFRTLAGADADVQWKSGGDVAIVSTTTPSRVYQAIIDPDRKLVDDDRSNNAWPPRVQVVFDSADVEVSSTEFGFSALAVGRLRYDYHQDLAVAGFYTNRGIGFTAGGRLHWGEPIDPTRFRNNLYTFYTYSALDSGFTTTSQPNLPHTGHLGGLGFRYDYTNVFWPDDPTDQRRFRIYTDWFDKGLGGNFDYVDWGYTASAVVPLWSHSTLAAAQIFNGFSEALNGSAVPTQGLYSLGGSLSIRGIGAEEQLARNIFVLRTELRQVISTELDLNLLDALVLRQLQVKALLDTGQVSNSAGHIYDVGSYACGVGVGFTAFYDFLGFFPSTAYLEIATRIDDPSKAGDVQVLFGSSQAF